MRREVNWINFLFILLGRRVLFFELSYELYKFFIYLWNREGRFKFRDYIYLCGFKW